MERRGAIGATTGAYNNIAKCELGLDDPLGGDGVGVVRSEEMLEAPVVIEDGRRNHLFLIRMHPLDVMIHNSSDDVC